MAMTGIGDTFAEPVLLSTHILLIEMLRSVFCSREYFLLRYVGHYDVNCLECKVRMAVWQYGNIVVVEQKDGMINVRGPGDSS